MPRILKRNVDSFPHLQRDPNAIYIDKTAHIARLVSALKAEKNVLLARPRRFGKTLLVSTLQALFQGQEDLFAGTWIGQAGNWNWEDQGCPVVRLNMAIRDIHDPQELRFALLDKIEDLAQTHRIRARARASQSPGLLLERVIRDLSARHSQRVIVLIDEYDTPVNENLGRGQHVHDILDVMRAFYGAVKDAGDCIRYTFMTGIARFAHLGLFSGANNFSDLSFRPECADLMGFTHAEIANNPDLMAEIQQCAQNMGCTDTLLLEGLHRYYNGYKFSVVGEAVYNPLALAECLNILRHPHSNPYWTLDNLPHAWARSGQTSLLSRLLGQEEYGENLASRSFGDPVGVLETENYDIDNPDLVSLMYHAGYLTIQQVNGPDRDGRITGLGFPNQEVRSTFGTSLLRWQQNRIADWHKQTGSQLADALRIALSTGDLEALCAGINTFLKRFSYPLHSLPIQTRVVEDYERYYQAIVYAAFSAMQFHVQAEQATSRGRIDIVVELAEDIAVLELKIDTVAKVAVAQALARDYAGAYQTSGKKLTVYGLSFDRNLHIITDSALFVYGIYDMEAHRWQNEPVGR